MELVTEFLHAIPYDQILIQTLNGIVTGMILALVASGPHAHLRHHGCGELRPRRAVHAWRLCRAWSLLQRPAISGSLSSSLLWSLRSLGAALQITTLRPLLGRDPLTTILATFGLSLVLQNYALWQFGPVARKIHGAVHRQLLALLPANTPGIAVLIAALSAAIIGGFWLFLKYGTYGIWIRATTQDRVMAQAMGIPVPWVHTAAFAIGAGMAAASGVLFAPLVGVTHAMGIDWVLKAFIVVVVGGMGNLGGSIAASIFISLLEVLCLDLGRPGASRHRLLRRSHLDPAVPAHRPVRSDTKMSKGTDSAVLGGIFASSWRC